MHNRKLAEEWLAFAEKSLETAILLNRENHYTDVIAIDIQQTVEKALKALYAFEGIKIPRTHSLDILFNNANRRQRGGLIRLLFHLRPESQLNAITEYGQDMS